LEPSQGPLDGKRRPNGGQVVGDADNAFDGLPATASSLGNSCPGVLSGSESRAQFVDGHDPIMPYDGQVCLSPMTHLSAASSHNGTMSDRKVTPRRATSVKGGGAQLPDRPSISLAILGENLETIREVLYPRLTKKTYAK